MNEWMNMTLSVPLCVNCNGLWMGCTSCIFMGCISSMFTPAHCWCGMLSWILLSSEPYVRNTQDGWGLKQHDDGRGYDCMMTVLWIHDGWRMLQLQKQVLQPRDEEVCNYTMTRATSTWWEPQLHGDEDYKYDKDYNYIVMRTASMTKITTTWWWGLQVWQRLQLHGDKDYKYDKDYNYVVMRTTSMTKITTTWWWGLQVWQRLQLHGDEDYKYDKDYNCSVSRWRPQKVDKCMVLEYTHGLFIT